MQDKVDELYSKVGRNICKILEDRDNNSGQAFQKVQGEIIKLLLGVLLIKDIPIIPFERE